MFEIEGEYGILELRANERRSVMGRQIQWETSLTTAKAKAKREKKLMLMDFYNNL